MESVDHCSRWYQNQLGHPGPNSLRGQRILVFNCTGERQSESLLAQLVLCRFDIAIFCPNQVSAAEKVASSDLSNFTVSTLKELTRCRHNQALWNQLTNSTGQTKVMSSISDVVVFVEDLNRQFGNQLSAINVLVTGSMHLIGAFLTKLNPYLENE